VSAETLSIGELTFEVRRSERRKSVGLTVDRGGELLLHAPAHVSSQQLEEWTRGRLLWVYRKLAVKETKLPEPIRAKLEPGDTVYYLGRSYRLKFAPFQALPVVCQAGWFRVRQSERDDAERLLRTWFENNGARWLGGRVGLLSQKFGLIPSGVDVRDLGNRWGSCNAGGVINFHWRLLQLPVRLIDYVIAHELTHLVEPTHSPEFWRRLEAIMPDAEARKHELLDAGRRYLVL
jgi:predicted metal-dependent hydrolase